jgi:hypothetical protein
LANGQPRDPLKEITESMRYTIPQLGDNVLKHAKLVRVCKTKGCYRPVFVSYIDPKTGRIDYSCKKHGKRNRQQMDWLDATGSTMIEFRRVGLDAKES